MVSKGNNDRDVKIGFLQASLDEIQFPNCFLLPLNEANSIFLAASGIKHMDQNSTNTVIQ